MTSGGRVSHEESGDQEGHRCPCGRNPTLALVDRPKTNVGYPWVWPLESRSKMEVTPDCGLVPSTTFETPDPVPGLGSSPSDTGGSKTGRPSLGLTHRSKKRGVFRGPGRIDLGRGH